MGKSLWKWMIWVGFGWCCAAISQSKNIELAAFSKEYQISAGHLSPYTNAGSLAQSSFIPDASDVQMCSDFCAEEEACKSFDFAADFPYKGETACFLWDSSSKDSHVVYHNYFVHLEKRDTSLSHSEKSEAFRYQPWFHGNITEAQAFRTLSERCKVLYGCFLVAHDTSAGTLTIFIWFSQNVSKYIVVQNENHEYVAFDGNAFETFEGLLQYYMLPSVLPNLDRPSKALPKANAVTSLSSPQASQSRDTMDMSKPQKISASNHECLIPKIASERAPAMLQMGQPFIVSNLASAWEAISLWQHNENASIILKKNQSGLPVLFHLPTAMSNHTLLLQSENITTELLTHFSRPSFFHHNLLDVLNTSSLSWSSVALTAAPETHGRSWGRNSFDAFRWDAVVSGHVLLALYPPEVNHTPGSASWGGPDAWLANTLPNLAEPFHPLLCELQPGDVAVIPPKWWSLSYHLSTAVLVSELVCPPHAAAQCARTLRHDFDPWNNNYGPILKGIASSNYSSVFDEALGPEEKLFIKYNDSDLSKITRKQRFAREVLLSANLTYEFQVPPNISLSLEQFNIINDYHGCLNTVPNVTIATIHISQLTAELIKQHFVRRWPLKITTDGFNRSLGWGTDRWSSSYLKQKAGDEQVEVQTESKDKKIFDAHSGTHFLRFGEFLAQAYDTPPEKQQEKMYLNLQTNLHSSSLVLKPPLSLLKEDFSVPNFWEHLVTMEDMNLWVGHAPVSGAISRLHNDQSDNLYALVQGKKKFTIFSPMDSFNLYVNNNVGRVDASGSVHFLENTLYPGVNFSPVVYPGFDKEKHPRAVNATPLICELQAGDLMFLPSGWWHQVESFGQHIAVNFWSQAPDKKLLEYRRTSCNSGL